MKLFLNNIKTGELIRINKISDTGIYYTIYENKVYADSNLFPKDKRVNIDNINNISFTGISGTFEDIKYEAAIRLLSTIELDYTLNEDEQNWNIPKGSLGDNTTLRITIPNNVYDKALMARDDNSNSYYMLWQVIDYCQNGLKTITSNCTYNAMVQYLVEIFPEHLYVVEQYINDGVVVEYKDK
jgi:hypothetical protein